MEELITLEPVSGLKILPHWLAQPYFRVSTTSKVNTTKPVPKRVHGSDASHETDGEEVEDGGDERQAECRQDGSKRLKLTAVSTGPL